MANTIKNPAAGDLYFDRSGSAITDSDSQVQINGGSIKGIISSSTLGADLRNVDPGSFERLNPDLVAYSGAAGQVQAANSSAALGYRTEGEYIIKGYSTTVHGISNNAVKFPASAGNRRSIDKVEAVRTRRVATAIREGYWHEVSGIFTTDPTTSEDLSTLGTDNVGAQSWTAAASYTFLDGSPTGTTSNYSSEG